MKKICALLDLTPDKTFEYFTTTLRDNITQWDYFVNWKKVAANIETIEYELNLLNSLVGKADISTEATKLFLAYPRVVRAIPSLLGMRNKSLKVLVDVNNFVYENFQFDKDSIAEDDARKFAKFIVSSGLGALLTDKRIKNLPDYVTGVEVGLDSNGRKNRVGKLMENIVETFVADACKNTSSIYMPQATAKKIYDEWGIKVNVDKSSRIIDFAVNYNEKLFFIETNFYGGGGSKLKATATEYVGMNSFWNSQGIEFVWITDGNGWLTTLRPLQEYFDKADYLLNLEMLQKGVLEKIIL